MLGSKVTAETLEAPPEFFQDNHVGPEYIPRTGLQIPVSLVECQRKHKL